MLVCGRSQDSRLDPFHQAKEIRVHCKFDMHLLTVYLDWNFVRKNLILIRFDWMLINPNIYKDTHLAQSVLTSAETPGRISMTVMIFTFVFGILIGWMMHMLVPQSADDDEPNVSTDNATIASCDPNPPPSASLNEWLHVSHLTFLEAGWERVTTWMVLICIAFKTLFCNCFCRFLSLGSGYASAETANVQVEVASKGVSANMQHAPEAVGAQVILANAVYVTKTGKHYHHESCGHVRGGNSKRYTPCSFCRNEFLDG